MAARRESAAREAVVLLAVVCPDCGYNLNYIAAADRPAPYNSDMLIAPLQVLCDSCGERFKVPAAAVHDAQHECLRLLGEA